MSHRIAFAVCLFVLFAASVDAQTRPQNPSAIAFTPSPDHAQLTAYEADIKDATNQIIQTIALGKPEPDGNGEIVVKINVQPVDWGTYTIVVRSIAAGITGPPSTPTEPWDRAPGPPSKLRVQ